jgi:hypothetical protein
MRSVSPTTCSLRSISRIVGSGDGLPQDKPELNAALTLVFRVVARHK